MDPNKIHERVLEIQSQIQNVPEDKQIELINELLDIAVQAEEALNDLKLENNEE